MNDSLNYIRQTVILTKYYSFDLGSYKIRELIIKWTKFYPHHWIPLAVTEAIYQGRLKAVSIEQILNIWLKKGGINYKFNYEFIRLVQPDVNFELEQEQEFKDLFTNQLENIDCPEKSPLYTAPNYSNNYSSQKQDLSTSQSHISTYTTVDEFQPLDDYSQSFQKLKSLAISSNHSVHI